mmetsp:Transcript_105025/g.301950  ORF Transcript_105025/g.301950 Transcript_105025/m.301950 type:complete len:228 (-) Transcript_105025:15-698(-)
MPWLSSMTSPSPMPRAWASTSSSCLSSSRASSSRSWASSPHSRRPTPSSPAASRAGPPPTPRPMPRSGRGKRSRSASASRRCRSGRGGSGFWWTTARAARRPSGPSRSPPRTACPMWKTASTAGSGSIARPWRRLGPTAWSCAWARCPWPPRWPFSRPRPGSSPWCPGQRPRRPRTRRTTRAARKATMRDQPLRRAPCACLCAYWQLCTLAHRHFACGGLLLSGNRQ